MRREAPAASTMPAIASSPGVPRGIGRLAISFSNPPDPMRAISPLETSDAGDDPLQHKVEAVHPG